MFGIPQRPRSVEAALRDLRSNSVNARREAAMQIGAHADEHRERIVPALIEALQDDDSDVRAAAALALADCEAIDALPALVALVEDDRGFAQQMALAALGELGDARALPCIEASLESKEAPTRFQAVMARARVETDGDARVRGLLSATEDDDPLVRHIALRMGEEIAGDGDVDERLLKRARALLADDEDVVAIGAAVVLGRAGKRDGAEILVAVAGREIMTSEADDEAAAIELCGSLRLREAVDVLERRAFGKILVLRNDPFAWQARVALAALGNAKAIAWIERELTAWTRERRSLAAAAAGRAGLTQLRKGVAALRGDDGRADQDAVDEALAMLTAAEERD